MTACNYGSVLVGLAALLGIVTNAGCGSDNNTGSGAQTAGASGAAAGAVGAGAAGTSGGGAGGSVASAGVSGESTASGGVSGSGASGAASGGASGATSGGASGAASGGAGGSAAGAGGTPGVAGSASGGAGGAAAGSTGSAGAGGSTATFAAVSAIITKSCTTSGCHDGSNTHINYKTNLYSVLTTPLPTGTDRCVGSTLVAPSNTAGSFLLTAIKTGGACQKGGSNIGRMPDNCSAAANATNPCLSAAQVQTITDWIMAGAPM